MIGKKASQDPLVSIGVVTYNGEKYLKEQLDSLVNQSYSNLEIVVSDDASTDGTVDIVSEFLSDSRVRLIRNNINKGLRNNLNDLLPQLRGEFIAICDQDDVWHTDKIRLLMQNIGGASGIFSDSMLIDSFGESLQITLLESLKVRNPIIGDNYIGLCYKNIVSGHAALYRKNVIRGVLPLATLPIYDQQLVIYAAATGGVKTYPKPLVYHRQHENNSHNVGLIEKGKERLRRSRRRERSVQVGRNLDMAARIYLYKRDASPFWGLILARFSQKVGLDLQSERGAVSRTILRVRILLLSFMLFRYSNKRNVVSLAFRLAG